MNDCSGGIRSRATAERKRKEKSGYWSRIMEVKAPVFGQMIEMLREVFEENARLKTLCDQLLAEQRELVASKINHQNAANDLREFADCIPIGTIEDWESMRTRLHAIADIFSC